jgi:hypothetical protein
MYQKVTTACLAAIGVMAAVSPAPAQAAAFVRVPCNPAALAAAVTGAASGATLSLAPGCDYVLTGALPTVTQNLTINGHGATLERSTAPGTPAFTILTVDGQGDSEVTATLNRLNFHNGNSAITVLDFGSLTVTGGTFTANTAANGGAIVTSQNNGERLTGLVVGGNSATGDAGGVQGDGDRIEDSRITGSVAGADGGGVYTSVSMLSVSTGFTGTTISRNRAVTGGGGIYDDGPDATATLTTTLVTGNKPDNCEPTGTITDCTG